MSSSIGKKQIQGVAGLLLCGFLVTHLLGNFLLLKGNEAFNAYADKLAGFGIALYVAEAGLAACFLIHLGFGILLWLENRRARPVVIEELNKPYWAVGYIAVFILLGLHLSHAVHSAFQTLGFNHPKYTPFVKGLGQVFAWTIAAGYAFLAVWTFLKDLPGTGMHG